jgi:hypothetical protein
MKGKDQYQFFFSFFLCGKQVLQCLSGMHNMIFFMYIFFVCFLHGRFTVYYLIFCQNIHSFPMVGGNQNTSLTCCVLTNNNSHLFRTPHQHTLKKILVL